MRMRLDLKKSQKTLDTCTSQIIHRNETRSTRSAGKGRDSQICHFWELQTRNEQGRRSWERVKSIPRFTAYHVTVGCIETTVQILLFCLRIIYHVYNGPPARPNQVAFRYAG